MWKPIKNKRNLKTSPSPPIRSHSTPPGLRAKSDKEIAELFAEHLSDVFCPHNNDHDQEAEQEPATAIQSQERLNKSQLQPLNRKNTLKHAL